MKNPQTELKTAIEDRDMVTVGPWQLVDREIKSHLGDSLAVDEYELHDTETVHSHRNTWIHDDGQTVMYVSEHNEDHYWARIHIHGGEGSAGGFTCGVGKHSTDDPTEAVEWAYEYMNEHDTTDHLYD